MALAKVRGRGLDWGWIKVFVRVISKKELLPTCWFADFKCDMEVGGVNIGGGGGWRRDIRVALAKVWVGGLVWGWIQAGVFVQVFCCRELLYYSAVARLHSGVRARDGVNGMVGTGGGW